MVHMIQYIEQLLKILFNYSNLFEVKIKVLPITGY
jgi:hypothetical protein